MKRKVIRCTVALVATSALCALLTASAFAEEDEVHYSYGNAVNAGLDTGYTESSQIDKDDPHFGWSLGSFMVSGFSGVIEGEVPTFLKNAGDDVRLSFRLDQNIEALNGNDSIVIAEDTKGYDKYFGIPESNFGRGMLIVQRTDYQNDTQDPILFKDYLAGLTVGSNTDVDLFDEGDYDVALDYEIKSPGLLGNPLFPTFNNYRIHFKFKVRNSNAMVFLLDSATGNELFSGSSTPNGFRLDLGGSHYLKVNIRKELLSKTGEELVEDTKFNKTVNDGAVFTEPGIYTVTITNPNTSDEPTVKRICVGSDGLLMASVANSISIDEVKAALAQGATIASDGTLTQIEAPAMEAFDDIGAEKESSPSFWQIAAVVLGSAIIVLIIALAVSRSRRAKTTHAATSDRPQNPLTEVQPQKELSEGDDDE